SIASRSTSSRRTLLERTTNLTDETLLGHGATFSDATRETAAAWHDRRREGVEHPNPERYAGQRIFVVQREDYVYLVPFVEDEQTVFLKTIIPSRKATKQYLGEESDDEA